LYGRPFTDAWALADAALTSLVALLLLAAVLAARSLHGRAIAALALGIAAVGEAVVMTPVLTHAVALSELSTTPARALVAIAFAAGVVAAVLGFQALSREEAA
jgi:lipopolysaccharide export LptBFGC system permease protein LptF